jgi:UDP-glucuronate 4-epimerase
MGQVVMLEAARKLPQLKHFVYASSSSVYGKNTKLPFSVDDRTDEPKSLYGATKKSGELITAAYTDLYGIPSTGLRFFTVYGPWGRPDMAAFIFTRAILAGEPIPVFNDGEMSRDFTYIDDIVAGVVRALERPQSGHRIYNLGNNKSENLADFIAQIETALGRKADISYEPMQAGDVVATYADIEASKRDLGFEPVTPIEAGVPKFIDWYRGYYKV